MFGLVYLCCVFFFFSSRRRHTRLQGDWSSDVCSSDLCGLGGIVSLGWSRDIQVLLRLSSIMGADLALNRGVLCGLGGIVSDGRYRDAQVLLRLTGIMGTDLALNRGVLCGLGGIVIRYSTGDALMFLRRGAMLLRLCGIMGTDLALNRVGCRTGCFEATRAHECHRGGQGSCEDQAFSGVPPKPMLAMCFHGRPPF